MDLEYLRFCLLLLALFRLGSTRSCIMGRTGQGLLFLLQVFFFLTCWCLQMCWFLFLRVSRLPILLCVSGSLTFCGARFFWLFSAVCCLAGFRKVFRLQSSLLLQTFSMRFPFPEEWCFRMKSMVSG